MNQVALHLVQIFVWTHFHFSQISTKEQNCHIQIDKKTANLFSKCQFYFASPQAMKKDLVALIFTNTCHLLFFLQFFLYFSHSCGCLVVLMHVFLVPNVEFFYMLICLLMSSFISFAFLLHCLFFLDSQKNFKLSVVFYYSYKNF